MSGKCKVMHGTVRSEDYGGDYCSFPPTRYLEVLDALIWSFGTNAGRTTPQAKQLTELIREIAK